MKRIISSKGNNYRITHFLCKTKNLYTDLYVVATA